MYKKLTEICIQIHHCSSQYTAEAFLLPYCPLRGISGQSHAIGRHSPPRTVDESHDIGSFVWEESVINFGWILRLEMSRLSSFFGGIVGIWVFWVQVKIFYCEPAARWKKLKLGEHALFIKRKWLRIFSDFSYELLRVFAKFLECISLYGIFLKNCSMNLNKNLPRALHN